MKIYLNTHWKCLICFVLGAGYIMILDVMVGRFGFWGVLIPISIIVGILTYYISMIPGVDKDDLEES